MFLRFKFFCLGAVATGCLAGTALAQARSRYQWNRPGLSGIRTIGGDFGTYSAGLGGLTRGGSSGSSLLRSSITGGGDFALRRSSGVGSGAVTGTSGLPGTGFLAGQSYKLPRLELNMSGTGTPSAGGGGMGLGLPNLTAGGVGLAAPVASFDSYLQAMGHVSALTSEEDKPITSFIPEEPSEYRDQVKRGEDAFRDQRYGEAESAFGLGLTYARYSPECHLSNVHVKFALGKYHTAAYHLRQALTYFPELPLAKLRVRGFYATPEAFVGHVEKLRQAIERTPYAAHHWLVLAYFRYFDDAESEAAEALRRAFELSRQVKDEPTTKAAQRFWDGMVAAGKVSGSLAPTGVGAIENGSDEQAPRSSVQEPATRPVEKGGRPSPGSSAG